MWLRRRGAHALEHHYCSPLVGSWCLCASEHREQSKTSTRWSTVRARKLGGMLTELHMLTELQAVER